MTFDGDRTAIEPLTVAQELYLIIVDLAGCKDTQEILVRLNQGYPVAKNNVQQQVQHYLGAINANLVRQAQYAIQQGDAATFGSLMQQAQVEFDRCVAPACPAQLNSPILHELLSYQPLQPYIYGGKGVGSQGDGTAQFIACNQDCQQQAIALIEQSFPQMHCYELYIPQNRTMLA